MPAPAPGRYQDYDASLTVRVKDVDALHQRTAQAIAALCVGGMVVARAMNDGTFANQLCNASMAVALRLGGWNDRAILKPGKAQRQRRGQPY